MFSIMSPGENTRPILKKKKMILSIELIEENTYARTSFDNGNRALKLKRKPSWQIVLQSRILDNFPNHYAARWRECAELLDEISSSSP